MNSSDGQFTSEDDPIEAAAAAWLAEREDGFSSAQAREFEQWRRLDPRHAAAVERLEQTCALLERLPLVRARLPLAEETPFPVAETSPATNRRWQQPRWIGGWAAAAAAICLLGWWIWPASVSVTRYSTVAGAYERVTLPDGSIVELNANSAVEVRFTAEKRCITLAAGEAHFSVTHDTLRPFIVQAGAISVRAVGTAFNVRMAAAEVEVFVTEGKVAVGETADHAANSASEARQRERPAVRVRAELGVNERLLIPSAPSGLAPVSLAIPVVEKIAPDVIRQALSWQERKLVFVETPLHKVAEQFNRRNRLQLVIADPALAERPVGGTFAADNVETFVRLLENSGDITVERRGEWEIELRRAKPTTTTLRGR